MGGVCACSVDARDLFKHAILSNATQIMLFHNHLSSRLQPSREDIEVTERIKKAGEILGIRLLDHIIIGPGKDYLSFKEEGISPFERGKYAS